MGELINLAEVRERREIEQLQKEYQDFQQAAPAIIALAPRILQAQDIPYDSMIAGKTSELLDRFIRTYDYLGSEIDEQVGLRALQRVMTSSCLVKVLYQRIMSPQEYIKIFQLPDDEFCRLIHSWYDKAQEEVMALVDTDANRLIATPEFHSLESLPSSKAELRKLIFLNE
jgi:hypothetical protein